MAWWGPSGDLESGPKHEQRGVNPARVGDAPDCGSRALRGAEDRCGNVRPA